MPPSPLSPPNGTPNLPPSTCPSLRLLHPTPAELSDLHHLNASSWRGPLALPAYLRREAHLAAQDLTRDGGITHWVLVDAAESAEPGERTILASCETIRKRGLVAYEDGARVVVRDVVSHGIGSVFCEVGKRGRGYAGRMMGELGRELRGWQVGGKGKAECVFTTLFSDVGKTFYAKHGWHPFPSSHISMLPIKPGQAVDDAGLSSTRALTADELAELCRVDEAQLRTELSCHAPPRKARVALVPDVETMRWHHAREEFVADELLGRTPEVKGAMVTRRDGRRAWCIWTRMWFGADEGPGPTSTMYILRMVFEGGEDIESRRGEMESDKPEMMAAALLLAARREAAAWDMDEVHIWNPSPTIEGAAKLLAGLLPAELKGKDAGIVHREDDSITCLNWYGDDEGLLRDTSWTDVDWVANEKYGWC